MHNPSVYRHIRAAARTVCAGMLAIRAADVVALIDMPEWVWFAMLPFFTASIGVAAWGSYRLRVHQAHLDKEAAERRAAEAEAKVLQMNRDDLLEGDEDRDLWASVRAAGSDDDTCAFTATNVIAINQYRSWPRAG